MKIINKIKNKFEYKLLGLTPQRIFARVNGVKVIANSIPKGGTHLLIKHRMKENSLKMYDKWSVLRVETTINNPREFKIYREVERCGEKVMR